MSQSNPEQLLVTVDTREKLPWTFSYPTERAVLASGDYTISGLQHLIAVERKSLADLVGCIGRGRSRFKNELQRLRAYRFACVIVEADFRTLADGDWRGDICPSHLIGSIVSWSARYRLPIWLAGNRDDAAVMCEKFLVSSVRILLEEVEAVVPMLKDKASEKGVSIGTTP